MEKREKGELIEAIDKAVIDLQNVMDTAQDSITKLKKLRDNLTGQTKLTKE
jgi:hypothetical protein